jgi:hypothetical protein
MLNKVGGNKVMIQKVEDLLKDYNRSTLACNPKRIKFLGFEGYDIYNPTAPFDYNDKKIIIGRVEKRESELSEAVFFVQQEDGSYIEFKEMPRYVLQDPFIKKIGNYWVFGGTEVFDHPTNQGHLWWRTKFYYGESLEALEPLTVGPSGMKDIRLVGLKDGGVGVFTRPQGIVGGRGKIGFVRIESIVDLTETIINNATLLDLFDDEEWGGVNDAYLLEDGKIGVLGHIAKYSEGTIRHYYPMAFTIDPNYGSHSKMHIIASRGECLEGPSKRVDLVDVLFSSGLVFENEKVTLYIGVSDVEVQSVEIANPF